MTSREGDGFRPAPEPPEADRKDRHSDHDGWTIDAQSSPPPRRDPTPVWKKEVWQKIARRRPDAEDRASSSEAIDLVSQAFESTPSLDPAAEMHERFALGDFSGALAAAELLIGSGQGGEEAKEAKEEKEAKRVADASRTQLVAHYVSRLGGLDRVPTLVVAAADVRWLGIDHRAGFLLAQIDGATTTEGLLDISGMPVLETLKTLLHLVDAGAIRFD